MSCISLRQSLEAALCLRSVSVLTIAFGGLICHLCHRWPYILLNVGCTLFSNPTLSANVLKLNKLKRFRRCIEPTRRAYFVFGMSDMQFCAVQVRSIKGTD